MNFTKTLAGWGAAVGRNRYLLERREGEGLNTPLGRLSFAFADSSEIRARMRSQSRSRSRSRSRLESVPTYVVLSGVGVVKIVQIPTPADTS